MKYPKHLILDVNKSLITFSSQYWIINYFFNGKTHKWFSLNTTLHQKFLYQIESKTLNSFFLQKRNNTLRYSHTHQIHFLSETIKKFYEQIFQIKIKVKTRIFFSKHFGKETLDFKELEKLIFDVKYIKRLVKNFKNKHKISQLKNNHLTTLFDINFLRKEKTYTKLKYSRVPQYDIVSGGSAALFAGFLGFLICEKFGFELVDSGDFYFLFMYLVFFIFACRFYLKLINDSDEYWQPFSFKWLIAFYITIFSIFINTFKKITNV